MKFLENIKETSFNIVYAQISSIIHCYFSMIFLYKRNINDLLAALAESLLIVLELISQMLRDYKLTWELRGPVFSCALKTFPTFLVCHSRSKGAADECPEKNNQLLYCNPQGSASLPVGIHIYSHWEPKTTHKF